MMDMRHCNVRHFAGCLLQCGEKVCGSVCHIINILPGPGGETKQSSPKHVAAQSSKTHGDTRPITIRLGTTPHRQRKQGLRQERAPSRASTDRTPPPRWRQDKTSSWLQQSSSPKDSRELRFVKNHPRPSGSGRSHAD
jgi:hypothetical protein